MDLISVIVPVYKVEAYLDRCVQSIVDQTYTNLEIILVDDGSPDNCPAMCDAWAEKDSRIKVIHTPNGGVSIARNIGLQSASGEYICLVDSDDWIDPRFVELLYWAIKEYNASIAACRMRLVYEFDSYEKCSKEAVSTKIYNTEDAMRSLIHGGAFQGGPCDKMYHRSVLKNIDFVIGRRHEDEFFTFRVIDNANRLVYIDAVLYYYFQRADSFMHSDAVEHLDALDAYLERIDLLQAKYPALCTEDKVTFCIFCVSLYRDLLKCTQKETKQHKKTIKESRKKVAFHLSEIRSLSLKSILYVFGSDLCLPLFACILNMRNRGNIYE